MGFLLDSEQLFHAGKNTFAVFYYNYFSVENINGTAGSFSEFSKLGIAVSCQPKRTFAGCFMSV